LGQRRARMRSGSLGLRVGIAAGPVTAGVIGRRRLAYDVWGDTVNLASRLQSTAEAGSIQVSDATVRLLDGSLPFEPRPSVEIKGKGRMTTYVLDPDLVKADRQLLASLLAPDPPAGPAQAPVGP
jgi:adenylate cyclase